MVLSASLSFRLLLIPDWEASSFERVLERFRAFAAAAAPFSLMLDLRAKSWSARRLLGVGERFAPELKAAQQGLAVSERLDVAELLSADLLHLGETSVPSARARVLQPGRPLLRACHEPARAGEVDAEFVLLSPIQAARKGNPALGVRGIEVARASLRQHASSAQLVALGGIDAENAAECLAAGASALAVMGGFESGSVSELLAASGAQRSAG